MSGTRKKLLAGAVVVVLLAVGGYAYAEGRGDGSSYRTAVAGTGTVQRTLSVTGDVAASGRRDLAFGASGTVKKVLVKLGKHVRKGQVLAKLGATGLRADVIAAKATLARAKAQLVSDESSTGSSASSGSASASSGSSGTGRKKAAHKSGKTNPSGTGASSGGATTNGPGKGSGTGTKVGAVPTLDPDGTVAAAETALTARTSDLTTALDHYVSFVEKTCATSDSARTGQPCDPSATATTCTDVTVRPSSLADAKGCVAKAQDAVSSAANALSTTATTVTTAYLTAVKAYAAQIQEAATAAGTAKGAAQGKEQAAELIAQAQVQAEQMIAQARKQASAGSRMGSSSPTSAQTSTSSEKQLASDRAAIASARASLVSARQSAKGAILRSPISGKVVDVAVEKGGSVSTSDTAVTVLGAGQTIVSATVTLAQVPNVKRGQSVSIVPAGWTRTLHGRVTNVGLVATTATSGTTTYPITVTIKDAPSIPLGMTAALSIVTGSATDAVTVPTSAVTRGTRSDTVTVLSGGKATRTRVTVGLVGTSRTTIKSGLRAGQRVVVADLDASLPSGNSSSSRRRSGFGGLGGGGGGPVRIGG